MPNVLLPANELVDLYLDPEVIAAGITAGDKILIQNVGHGDIWLQSSTALPILKDRNKLKPYAEAVNAAGDVQAIAYAAHIKGEVNVKLAV